MRVLLSAHNVAWQGSAIRALSLARPLARLGHETTVLASRQAIGASCRCCAIAGWDPMLQTCWRKLPLV
jgi:hypothetical protein